MDRLNVQADEWLSRHPDELADVNHEIQRSGGTETWAGMSRFKYCLREDHGIIDRYPYSDEGSWEFLSTSRMVRSNLICEVEKVDTDH